jgi:hypothetical protein
MTLPLLYSSPGKWQPGFMAHSYSLSNEKIPNIKKGIIASKANLGYHLKIPAVIISAVCAIIINKCQRRIPKKN